MRYQPSLRQSVESLRLAADKFEQAIAKLKAETEQIVRRRRNEELNRELREMETGLTNEDNPSRYEA